MRHTSQFRSAASAISAPSARTRAVAFHAEGAEFVEIAEEV